MAASTVKFSYDVGGAGESIITVNGPGGATDPELLPEWVSDLTADLTRISYRTVNNEVWHWRMSLSSLTTAQKNALLTFYRASAQGPSLTFLYLHTDSTEYTARFIEVPKPRRVSNEEWDVDIVLEIDGTLAS